MTPSRSPLRRARSMARLRRIPGPQHLAGLGIDLNGGYGCPGKHGGYFTALLGSRGDQGVVRYQCHHDLQINGRPRMPYRPFVPAIPTYVPTATSNMISIMLSAVLRIRTSPSAPAQNSGPGGRVRACAGRSRSGVLPASRASRLPGPQVQCYRPRSSRPVRLRAMRKEATDGGGIGGVSRDRRISYSNAN